MKFEEKFFNFLLFLVVGMMLALTFELRSGARLMPLLVGSCTFFLTVMLCVMTIAPRFEAWYQNLEGKPLAALSAKSRETEITEAEINAKKIPAKEKAVIAWLLFLTIATYCLGFLIAIPLFLFLFLRFWAKESWRLSLCMTGVVYGAVYGIFIVILQVPLHRGVFF